MATNNSTANNLKLEERLMNLLFNFGIPANLKGFHYLREGIILTINDRTYLASITRRLYPAIAEKFDTTSSRVERAIRHAIQKAFDSGNFDFLQKFFGNTIKHSHGKVTNSEFIAIVTERISLELKSKTIF